VYAVCAAVEDYPTWWREVRSVVRVSEDVGDARVRSLLPITLRLRLVREVDDPATGRLRVGLSGDLTGWAEFLLTPGGGGTEVVFRQEVEVTVPVLRRVAPVLAPLLRANHSWMMRSCRHGMQRLLADV
jgi:hypothetical protein